MKRFSQQRISCSLGALASALSGCVGTTGGDVFSFEAFAAGPLAADGGTYTFSARGYDVTLERAKILVGAAYLNRAVPTSGAGPDTSCTLAGIYSAEVTAPLVVDALSPELQPFPVLGQATSEPSFTGEVWLNEGDIDDPADSAVVLDVAGSAEKDGLVHRFEGKLTIGENRRRRAPPETPGAHPICKERIVTPIPVEIVPAGGGQLVLRIDPAQLFANVDYAALTTLRDGVLVFDDARETSDHPVDQPSKALYQGLRSTSSYAFSWNSP